MIEPDKNCRCEGFYKKGFYEKLKEIQELRVELHELKQKIKNFVNIVEKEQ